ncbi:glycoside hydrolase family 51 protein [Baudoinia panamericana UAMH 10762]|uniref:non-reducing end alpha-L-arabinofuranosidase n=1 Tax=Baudoinia panamericana (strain UAMH 10762) TaxID=717646 RepID=M2MU80_BAUPA|nr:glycoside hydrolase family 51 protein [Baudoinia panamericana UAMH 10762]EMC95118.1 glycoside hydrolase family 51 protein [Baudoinia panamericana UAMH 10762]
MLSTLLSASLFAAVVRAVSFTVGSANGNATSPYQYGLIFEDINHAGDGGVYAELIQNRAFQGDSIFPKNLNYWNPLGGAALSLQNLSTPLSSALPTSMQVTAGNSTGGTIGFSNVGFWGFPVVAGWQYNGSFWVEGALNGNVTIALVSNSNTYYAEASVAVHSSSAWTQYNYTFTPTVSAPNSNNTLNFTFASSSLSGAVNFNLLSLFPPTYKNRPNGNRIDLMDAMAGLYPSFFRAPGGNNVEGLQPPYWWNWTQSLGPLQNRNGYPGTWGYEQTNGLGLIEYMLWAQDLGMEPILALWSGLWLNASSVPQSGIQVYVQAALDELEFLMGDASTTWGALRESLGYGPFQINFVEIGNEDSLLVGSAATYSAYRFQAFYDAVSAAYPNITIIASYYDVNGVTPPDNAAGDIHNYELASQFARQFTLFDNYTSAHPILLGEYAVIAYDAPGVTAVQWNAGAPREFVPVWYSSVGEAVYLLGAERNSDKVIGAAYAPTFQNLNSWAWIPDMIQFDAYPGHTTLSTSYYVVQLLSGTRITENLPITITSGQFGPAYFVAGRNSETGSHIAKFAVYNATANGTSNYPISLSFDGVGPYATGNLTYLNAPMNSTNPIGGNVVTKTVQTVTASRNGTFSFTLPDWTVAILEVGANNAGQGYGYGNPGNRPGWLGPKSWGRDSWNGGGWGNPAQGWHHGYKK